jgi:hypothetical protein
MHKVQHQHVLMKPPPHLRESPNRHVDKSVQSRLCGLRGTGQGANIGPWGLVSSGIEQRRPVFPRMTKCFQGSRLWRRYFFEQDETQQDHQLCDSRPMISATAARGFPTRCMHRMAFLLSLIQRNPSEPTTALLRDYPISYEQEGTHSFATCLHHRSLVIKRPQQK